MTAHDTIEPVRQPSARSDAAYATAAGTSSVAGGARPPRGWRPTPGVLVSLWDMLRLDAKPFVALMQGLAGR